MNSTLRRARRRACATGATRALRRSIGAWLVVVLSACSRADESAPPPQVPFAGVVALNANLSANEPITDYEREYRAVAALGARGAQTAAPWRSLNPTGTTYDLTLLTNPYFGPAALGGYGFRRIFLNVPVVALTQRAMPDDLVALAFNDPAVKTRLRALFDRVLPLLPNAATYLALGNEVDAYFSTRPNEWAAFIELVEDARTYIRTRRPDLAVGVTTTFAAATGAQAAAIATLNASMDFVALTYYPVDTRTFAARAPTAVADDVAAMLALGASRPVVLQQWGYPSSPVLGSGEAQQGRSSSLTPSAPGKARVRHGFRSSGSSSTATGIRRIARPFRVVAPATTSSNSSARWACCAMTGRPKPRTVRSSSSWRR
ncbi:MAG: hypothetical protein ACK4V1_08910 [Burkholderiaceae bacterium]